MSGPMSGPGFRRRRTRPEPVLSSPPMYLRQFVIDGLGHISALVADEVGGVAAVVDPRRDVDIYLAEAQARDLRITQVLETHLHNDYVSGARELAGLTGAVHAIGAGAELAHGFRGVRDGDALEVGSLHVRVLETPGHTPEHVSYSLADRSRADDPLLLFTGGSLLVGAVGRTDLLGADRAEPYARDMYRSLHDVLLPHEDFVAVLPTHGGGSLCSKSISSTPSSTVGFERRHNELLAIADVDDFCRRLLEGQPSYPGYFSRMRPINQAGPRPLGSIPSPTPLPVGRVRELLASGHLLLDLRHPAAHAAGHVPGSLSIPAGTSFGTWLGWVVAPDRPLVLLLERPMQWDDAVRQALRIGHENIVGHVQGGFAAWQESGGAVESTGRLSVTDLRRSLERNGAGPGNRRSLVLDVRQRDEYETGHVPGAVHLHAGDLPERLSSLPRDAEILAICASGYRSSVAASLLRQAGFERVSWVSGGVPAWDAAGYPLER
jgi:hydroxyacylglutathione hydrolase